MREKILITGSKGLVGSKFVELFSADYEFETIDVSDPIRPINITNREQVELLFSDSEAEHIIHLAAFTDVNKAWEQRGDTTASAYQVNVVGTKIIAEAAKKYNKHLIHISTAYVFDGQKSTLYHEDDPICPIEWYGQTKAMAEEEVLKSKCETVILRIDQPFRSDPFVRPDVVRKMIQNIQSSAPYPLFNNHYLGPTYIDDFAKVIDWTIRNKIVGLYHASSGEKISDFELGQKLNHILNLNGKVIAGNLDDYLKKLSRPYQINTALDISKLKSQIDFELKSLDQAIKDVKF